MRYPGSTNSNLVARKKNHSRSLWFPAMEPRSQGFAHIPVLFFFGIFNDTARQICWKFHRVSQLVLYVLAIFDAKQRHDLKPSGGNEYEKRRVPQTGNSTVFMREFSSIFAHRRRTERFPSQTSGNANEIGRSTDDYTQGTP